MSNAKHSIDRTPTMRMPTVISEKTATGIAATYDIYRVGKSEELENGFI